MVASSRGFSKIARILLDNGALVDLVDNYGASAFNVFIKDNEGIELTFNINAE